MKDEGDRETRELFEVPKTPIEELKAKIRKVYAAQNLHVLDIKLYLFLLDVGEEISSTLSGKAIAKILHAQPAAISRSKKRLKDVGLLDEL